MNRLHDLIMHYGANAVIQVIAREMDGRIWTDGERFVYTPGEVMTQPLQANIKESVRLIRTLPDAEYMLMPGIATLIMSIKGSSKLWQVLKTPGAHACASYVPARRGDIL